MVEEPGDYKWSSYKAYSAKKGKISIDIQEIRKHLEMVVMKKL